MKLGRMAEDLACDYLIKRGHTILSRNWRSGHLELDVISLDPAGIHFVEVKARVAPAQAGPEENVGFIKQKKMLPVFLTVKWICDESRDALYCICILQKRDPSRIKMKFFSIYLV